ncbi:MAG: biotin--[acetyl-CoA-carboxylase] ligase [Polyangiaceae bacterium]|nr:biotin--[acetyl-CoA-carboxylase] ligase [Polyangiaceae bacterium]
MDFDHDRVLALQGARRVEVRAETGSTQDDARAAARDGAPAGSVFVADVQARGRGRQGRAWSAPAGSALLASVILAPRVDPRVLPRLSLVVGLAVARACGRRVAGVGVKWPNDVEILGRKVSGVLVEASFRGHELAHVVAGFGVNVRRASLPPDVGSRATSLEAAGASDLDRAALLADVLRELDALVPDFERDGLAPTLAELRALDVARGREVEGDAASGRAAGIDDDGRLLVETARGVVAVNAGEVLFRGSPARGHCEELCDEDRAVVGPRDP